MFLYFNLIWSLAAGSVLAYLYTLAASSLQRSGVRALIDGHILGQTPWFLAPGPRSRHTTLFIESTQLITPCHICVASLAQHFSVESLLFLTHCFKETGDFGRRRKYHISPPQILRVGMWRWQWMPPWCNIKLENLILSSRSGQVNMIMKM